MQSKNPISRDEFYESTIPGIYINSGQPGTGKTRELKKHINSNFKNEIPKRILIFSSNHDHLEDIEASLPKKTTQRLQGFERLCFMIKYHEKLKDRYKTYNNPKDTVCKSCGSIHSCDYRRQFKFLSDKKSDIVTILAPLEFAYLPPLQDWADDIYIDESVEKLNYHNIGVNKQDKINMAKVIQRLGKENNIDVKPLLKQLDIAYDIITSFQIEILKQGSILFNEKPEILDNLDTYTYEDDDYVIQNGNYITHPAKVKPILNDILREKLDQFNEETYEEIIFNLIRKDERNRLIEVFINFPGQINAIREMLTIFERKQKPFPVNINEKIEDRNSVDETNHAKELRGAWYKKKDGTYLISTIGKEYTSDNSKRIEKRANSWITFGNHMMHTVFEIAEYHPVKLMDSSFNKTCFDKLYNENQGNTDNLPVNMVEQKIKHNPNSHLYPVLTSKNKYQSNFSKSALGIAGGNSPNKKCLEYISDIRKFGRQANKEGKKVALITFKEIEENFIEPFGKKMIRHLGDVRGSNKQEKADIQTDFGTLFHPTKTVILDYISTFHEFPKDITPIKDTHGRFDGYADTELNEFFEWHVMEEQYQAIHRSRLLIHNKKIILFGKIPRKIIENNECTIEEPETFHEIQVKLLDTKTYYLKYPEEARQALMPKPMYNLDLFRKSIKDDSLLRMRAYTWNLSSEDVWEITLNAFNPIMKDILKCDWERKKPFLTAVIDSVQKTSRKCRKRKGKKMLTVKQDGYSRGEVLMGIAILEKLGSLEIDEVSLNDYYHDTKRGSGILLKFKK